jgi:hypothetical protein
MTTDSGMDAYHFHFTSESRYLVILPGSPVATAAYPTKVAQVHIIEEWKDARTT